MSIKVRCGGCGTVLVFEPAQVGASGPCFQCGYIVQVPYGQDTHAQGYEAPLEYEQAEPYASQYEGSQEYDRPLEYGQAESYAQPAQAGLEFVAPEKHHQKVIDGLTKEADKAGFTVAGSRVLVVGEEVSFGESVGRAVAVRLKSFGTSVRTDRLVQVKVLGALAPYVVSVPFTGGSRLGHEFASCLDVSLPTNLFLLRGAMGSWSLGRFETSAGEEDPIAEMAGEDLGDGIEWNIDVGNGVVKMKWGLQAVGVTPGRTMHVIQTAKIVGLRSKFGVSWYGKRQKAFLKFAELLPAKFPERYQEASSVEPFDFEPAVPISLAAEDWLFSGS